MVRLISTRLTSSSDVLAGKTYGNALRIDVAGSVAVIRYYAGWADKIQGKTMEVRDIGRSNTLLTTISGRPHKTGIF